MNLKDKDCSDASQGGEAVEVVAYRGKDRDGGEGFVGAGWPNAFGEDCIVERLMTVAQHQRILAASVGSAEPVAWARQCDLDESDPAIFVAREEVQESGYAVPLYTHPADQVAEPGAAQEIQWLEQWLLLAAEPIGQECCGQAYLECCGNAEPVYRSADEIAVAMNARREELRALLAKSEGLKP